MLLKRTKSALHEGPCSEAVLMHLHVHYIRVCHLGSEVLFNDSVHNLQPCNMEGIICSETLMNEQKHSDSVVRVPDKYVFLQDDMTARKPSLRLIEGLLS